MKKIWIALATSVLALTGSAVASHDDDGAAFVSYSDTDFRLWAADGSSIDAGANTPIMPGDSIETERGRLEIILADRSVLRLDRRTRLSFESIARTYGIDEGDDRTGLRLERGAVAIEVLEDPPSEGFWIETAGANIDVLEAGDYRVEFDGRGGTTVHVEHGEMRVATRWDRERLRDDEWAVIEDEGRVMVARRNWDEDRFDQWVAERIDRRDESWSSTRYLDSNLAYAAAEFDDHGSWYWLDDVDGYAWRPRVSFGWQPYVDGRWYRTPAGLTWISADPWGWVPYHYGSWVWSSRYGWCWVPGPSYSPAWVYWYYGSDYVGWCPRGYYDWYYGRRWGWGEGHAMPGFSVDVRIDLHHLDRSGWRFAPIDRVGSFDFSKHVISIDGIRGRVQPGIVTSRPLPLGGHSGQPVPDLLREVPRTLERLIHPIDDSARKFLRRDPSLDVDAGRSLRRGDDSRMPHPVSPRPSVDDTRIPHPVSPEPTIERPPSPGDARIPIHDSRPRIDVTPLPSGRVSPTPDDDDRRPRVRPRDPRPRIDSDDSAPRPVGDGSNPRPIVRWHDDSPAPSPQPPAEGIRPITPRRDLSPRPPVTPRAPEAAPTPPPPRAIAPQPVRPREAPKVRVEEKRDSPKKIEIKKDEPKKKDEDDDDDSR